MAHETNGMVGSSSDDDMRRELQNIQMQSNQITDDVSSYQ